MLVQWRCVFFSRGFYRARCESGGTRLFAPMCGNNIGQTWGTRHLDVGTCPGAGSLLRRSIQPMFRSWVLRSRQAGAENLWSGGPTISELEICRHQHRRSGPSRIRRPQCPRGLCSCRHTACPSPPIAKEQPERSLPIATACVGHCPQRLPLGKRDDSRARAQGVKP